MTNNELFLEDAILQLPTAKMLEEIIAETPNVDIETDGFYWLQGSYPKHGMFVDRTGHVCDVGKIMHSGIYVFKVRPVLYFSNDIQHKPGELIRVHRKPPNYGHMRTCVVIDKRRAIVQKPFCGTYHHDDWDAWLNSPSFKGEW